MNLLQKWIKHDIISGNVKTTLKLFDIFYFHLNNG